MKNLFVLVSLVALGFTARAIDPLTIKSTISEYASYLMKKILGKADVIAEKPDQLKEFVE